MIKPHFIFTQYEHSFRVYIANLEALTVPQIQTIEAFVQTRKGIFDFENYSFTISKKISFHEFKELLHFVNIEADCEEKVSKAIKSIAVVEFGQYKGMAYSDLPDNYLLWLKHNYRGQHKETIVNELRKRNL